MSQEVRAFDREKRGTWGEEPMYEELGGVVSRSLIQKVLDERRKAEGRVKRPRSRSYEFASPGVTYSTDFIAVRPRGRVLKVQDDRARYLLGFAHQDRWPDDDVTAFTEEILNKHGDPYFFKHDLGSEFRSGTFQAMLRRRVIVAVPSPPYYPKFNGKNERRNQGDRKWIAPTEADRPSVARVIEELTQATLDQNTARRKDVLGGRTPAEVWESEPRVTVDRAVMYSEWDRLREDILKRNPPNPSRQSTAEMEAMRLAAIVVVKRHQLVRYTQSPEVPEVST